MSKAAIEAKSKLVDQIADQFKEAKAAIVVDYLGLTVEEVTNLRKELRDNGVKMEVIKNTYLRRAADKAGLEGIDDTFVGPTAIAFSNDDVVAPAKILSKYAKDIDALEIKGGIIDGKVSSVEEINQLATMPSREGMLSMLMSVLQAPVRNLAYALNAVADSKDEPAA